MRWLLVLSCLSGCSNSFSMELITSTTEPGGPVRVSVLNDSVVDASWSPCDEAWFIETEHGRERDPTRRYCNLGHSFPLGESELTLSAPDRVGTFFLQVRVLRQSTIVPIELGPIEVAE